MGPSRLAVDENVTTLCHEPYFLYSHIQSSYLVLARGLCLYSIGRSAILKTL
jgi:hypothetical protein